MPSQRVSRTVPSALGGTAAGTVEIADLLPHLRGVVVERVECAAGGLVIWARWQPVRAECPRCGAWSSRVHSGYVRRLHDSPAGGRPVLIRLGMRRFLCTNPGCRAVTFAGQADGLTARYQRRSVPLARLLAQVALELAGRAGARLARALGITIHRSTLLRLVMSLPDPGMAAAPEVIGVDDFALRRGHVYGTILVDATTGQALDVLPGRESGPLADWLAAHPGARVICRDRAGAYAEGARDGAPAAVQVADRWHLWHNLAEHTVKAVARHRACLGQITAARPPDTVAGPEPDAATAATPESRLEARMRDQHATVQALAARGLGIRAIARELGADRKTARRFVQALTADDAVARAISRPTVLDRYQPCLHRRWADGCHDAAVLHAEITALGYRGSLRTVYRYLQPLRAGTAAPPGALPPLKAGQVTSWLLRRASDLNPRDQEVLAEIRAHCAQLDRLAGHVTSFAKMMTRRTGERDLPGWLEQVEADDQPELRTFAAGIRQDLAAVTAGLTMPYSSGSTEGNVNRLKALKRQMYGRASLDLLRKRVIHHPG